MTNSKPLCKRCQTLPDFSLEGSRFGVVHGLHARTAEPNLETPENLISRRLPETSADMARPKDIYYTVGRRRGRVLASSRSREPPLKDDFRSGYSLSVESARSSRYGRKRLPSRGASRLNHRGSPFTRCGQIENAQRAPLTTPIPLRFPTRLGRRPLLFDQFQRSLFVDQLPFTVVARGCAFQNQLFRFFRREGRVQRKQFAGEVCYLRCGH